LFWKVVRLDSNLKRKKKDRLDRETSSLDHQEQGFPKYLFYPTLSGFQTHLPNFLANSSDISFSWEKKSKNFVRYFCWKFFWSNSFYDLRDSLTRCFTWVSIAYFYHPINYWIVTKNTEILWRVSIELVVSGSLRKLSDAFDNVWNSGEKLRRPY